MKGAEMAAKGNITKEQYITKVLPKYGFDYKPTKAGFIVTKPGQVGACPTHRGHPGQYDSLKQFMGDLRRVFGFAPPAEGGKK